MGIWDYYFCIIHCKRASLGFGRFMPVAIFLLKFADRSKIMQFVSAPEKQ